MVVDRHDLALTRFANSFIHQNVAESTVDGPAAGARRRSDGRRRRQPGRPRTGCARWSSRTLAAARLCPPDPAWPGLTPPSPVHADGLPVDEATAHAEPDAPGRPGRAPSSTRPAGWRRPATAAPRTGRRRSPTAPASRRRAGPPRRRWTGSPGPAAPTGWPGSAAGRLDRPRRRGPGRPGGGQGAGRRRPGRAAAGPVRGGPRAGRGRRPRCRTWPAYGFNGKAVAERQSFAEPGAAQFDPAVTLVDDPTYGGAGLPFDVEGTPSRALTLVEAGVTRAVAHDRRTAAEAGTASTGHAVAGRVPPGARSPRNLRLLGGADPATGRPRPTATVAGPVADADTAALVAAGRPRPAGHRLLVHPGARPAEPGGHRADPQRGVADRGRRADRGRCRTCGSPSRTRGRWRRARCSASAGGRSASRTGRDGGWWEAPSLRLASLELHRWRLGLTGSRRATGRGPGQQPAPVRIDHGPGLSKVRDTRDTALRGPAVMIGVTCVT